MLDSANRQSPILEIQLDNIKLVSVNNMYIISKYRYKKINRTITSVCRSKEFTVMDDIVSDILDEVLDDNSIRAFKEYLNEDDQRAVRMTFNFHVPLRSFFQSDTSNFPKALEDVIKFKLNIDDCRNTKIIAEKFLSQDKYWHTNILLEIYELSYAIPKNRWPDHVLGKLPNNRDLIGNTVVRLSDKEITKKRYRTKESHPVFNLANNTKDPSNEINKVLPLEDKKPKKSVRRSTKKDKQVVVDSLTKTTKMSSLDGDVVRESIRRKKTDNATVDC